MPPDPEPAGEEPLESFYGLDAGEVRRLAEAEADAEAAAAARDAAGSEPRVRSEAGSVRKRGVTGALMAGIAMGFREVFERESNDRTAIEQPAPEQPLEPQKYEIHLDPVAPESSFAIYRPWVDGPDGDGDDAGPDSGPDRAPAPPVADRRPPGGGAGALGG